MKLKPMIAVLGALLPMLISVPAAAVLIESATFADVKSWGKENEAVNIIENYGATESYKLHTIGFSGNALRNLELLNVGADTAGKHLLVNIRYGVTDLGNFQLGVGDYSVCTGAGNPTGCTEAATNWNQTFSGVLDVTDIAVTSSSSFDFRFFESFDDWADSENDKTQYDAIWKSISFDFNGERTTTPPPPPGVPEPGMLALLGLGLAGLGLMRRRVV